MSGAEQQPGFAATLLARAKGEVSDLRPKITPYFGSTEPSDALPEITEEIAVAPDGTPPAQTQRAQPLTEPDQPAQQAPMPAEAVAEPVQEAPLMPSDAVAPATPAPEIQAADPPPPGVMAAPLMPVPEPPKLEVAAPTPIPTPIPNETPKPAEPATPAALPDVAKQLAAALARLTSDPVEAQEQRLMPEAPQAEPPAPQQPTAAENPAAPQADDDRSQPLTIHIGEVIVAPDPPAPTPPQQRAPRPKWTPALTLDDYRTSRARGTS
ncbi:MAG: hypothetical protein AAF245_06245 [Pseudomonadota bacterium]